MNYEKLNAYCNVVNTLINIDEHLKRIDSYKNKLFSKTNSFAKYEEKRIEINGISREYKEISKNLKDILNNFDVNEI